MLNAPVSCNPSEALAGRGTGSRYTLGQRRVWKEPKTHGENRRSTETTIKRSGKEETELTSCGRVRSRVAMAFLQIRLMRRLRFGGGRQGRPLQSPSFATSWRRRRQQQALGLRAEDEESIVSRGDGKCRESRSSRVSPANKSQGGAGARSSVSPQRELRSPLRPSLSPHTGGRD
ncbi:hypothetical protein AGIG_G18934 [Arapaima gigas]